MSEPATIEAPKSPLREITQPFVDLVHSPRALWGVNGAYLIEGMCYFGVLGYLAMHFSDFIFRGVPNPDVNSHHMVMVLTAGITIAMFFLGFVADKFGVRRALIWAFLLMLAGRALMAGAPTFGLQPNGMWSSLHLATMAGILLIVIGYGMYQPGAYAAVRQFTTPKTANMAYAMLYALMNLGGYLPTYAFLLRDQDWLGFGIVGTFWFYTAMTVVSLVLTVVLLTRKTVDNAIATAKAETEEIKRLEPKTADGQPAEKTGPKVVAERDQIPLHMWGVWLVLVACAAFLASSWPRIVILALLAVVPALVYLFPKRVADPTRLWIANHPFADLKFFFFIFALIPVQTLFTYNWLILPQYINRAYSGWIGRYFEIGSNFNPLLIFIMVPIVTALLYKAKVYNQMIVGTAVMAAPAFLLAFGPTWYTLLGYLVLMTLGEAMWQPRFLQYAAEIAPPGRTGIYMGVAQFPWFMTKMLVPLYSGYMLQRYCPADGPKNTETMWLIFGFIAVCSTILLVLAKGWLGKDFKTSSAT
jgi:proton-dependent oligopeptide transporter, POT family